MNSVGMPVVGEVGGWLRRVSGISINKALKEVRESIFHKWETLCWIAESGV